MNSNKKYVDRSKKIFLYRYKICTIFIVVFTLSSFAFSDGYKSVINELPEYHPKSKLSGTITTWGHGSFHTDFMGGMVRSWEEGFRKYHPDVKFEDRLHGTASAIGALYGGVGDLAIMGREIRDHEIEAFNSMLGYEPTGIELATGSLNIRNMDFALGVFVHKSNPLSKLSMDQLRRVFSSHVQGEKPLRYWRDLGIQGEWADKVINLYGYAINRGFSVFFSDAVMGGRNRWNCTMKEFSKDEKLADGDWFDSGQKILNALADDKYGLAFSGMLYKHHNTKTVALSPRGKNLYYKPTIENVLSRDYPLTRVITSYINHHPTKAIDESLSEYLSYILSRQGQQAIVDADGYLPLTAELLFKQRRILKLLSSKE